MERSVEPSCSGYRHRELVDFIGLIKCICLSWWRRCNKPDSVLEELLAYFVVKGLFIPCQIKYSSFIKATSHFFKRISLHPLSFGGHHHPEFEAKTCTTYMNFINEEQECSVLVGRGSLNTDRSIHFFSSEQFVQGQCHLPGPVSRTFVISAWLEFLFLLLVTEPWFSFGNRLFFLPVWAMQAEWLCFKAPGVGWWPKVVLVNFSSLSPIPSHSWVGQVT